MRKITQLQYQNAQNDPNFLPWLAKCLDVTPKTVTVFIPEEVIKASRHPFNDIPLVRFTACARRIQTRQPELELNIGIAVALAKYLASQL